MEKHRPRLAEEKLTSIWSTLNFHFHVQVARSLRIPEAAGTGKYYS